MPVLPVSRMDAGRTGDQCPSVQPKLVAKYNQAIDSQSAYEILTQIKWLG